MRIFKMFHAEIKRLLTASALTGILALAASSAQAEPVTVKIIHVQDGDTVTALMPSTEHLRIRIAGIDAPESRQDFGTRSRQMLSRLVKGKTVQAEALSQDRYGRYVAVLTLNGGDVGLAMISAGLAWAYRDYFKDLPEGYAEAYEQAENEARRSGRGLWGAPYPMEPWKWRRVYREMWEKGRAAGKNSSFPE